MENGNRHFTLGEEFADLLSAPVTAPGGVDTKGLCEALIANLESQHGIYSAYAAQVARQRMALVNRDLDGQRNANTEAERLLNALGALEEERVAVTGRILGARNTGAAATPVKCEAVYPLVDPAQARRLKECRDALVGMVGGIRQALELNRTLVENGRSIIHTTIGIMTSVVGRTKADKMNTYNAKGGVRVAKLQIRNLVNRSV